jgi:acetyltransferase-like isoleucine patch superfamily enzyme
MDYQFRQFTGFAAGDSQAASGAIRPAASYSSGVRDGAESACVKNTSGKGDPTHTPIPLYLHDPYSPRSFAAALKRFGPVGLLSLARQLLAARWQLRTCNKTGKWVRVRGKVTVHNEGTIVLGDRVRFRAEGSQCELATWNDGRIEIGEGTTLNYGTSISAGGSVKIGQNCLIGTHVNVMDTIFHNIDDRSWNMEAEPVVIEDNVWLGNRCVIMKGVTVGRNSVVAACSLVTRDVPPNSMVVGVPARVVKNL